MRATLNEMIRRLGAFCALFFLACALLAGPGGALFPAWAGLDYMPRLAPTSGWLVGQAATDDQVNTQGVPLPCVAMNQFENGFTVRLSGGGGRIIAMALDFRQDALGRGERYPVRISVDHSYAHDFEGSAFDSGTLVIDTSTDSALFSALAHGQIMIVGLGGSVAAFDLKGMPDGLARLDSCYRPMPPAGAQQALAILPQPAAQDLPSAGAEMAAAPESPIGMRSIGVTGGDETAKAKTAKAETAKPEAAQEGEASSPPLASLPPLKIDAALNLAAKSVTQVQRQKNPEDIATQATQAQSARIQTAKSQAAKAAPAPENTPEAIPVQDIAVATAPRAPDPVSEPSQTPAQDPAQKGDQAESQGSPDSPSVLPWNAQKGEDVRDVLSRWSQKAGVNLVWTSKQSGIVRNDFHREGDFQGAVLALLAETGQNMLATMQGLPEDGGPGSPSFQALAQNYETARTQFPIPLTREPSAPRGNDSRAPQALSLDSVRAPMAQTAARLDLIAPASGMGIVQAGLAQPGLGAAAQRNSTSGKGGSSEVPGAWTAQAGTDLRDTLAAWSRRAGVALVWQSPAVFSVPADMSFQNGYESAVAALLENTASGSLRPVGEIHRDPGSGRSELVIRVRGSL